MNPTEQLFNAIKSTRLGTPRLLELVNELIEAGADLTAQRNEAIREAAWHGHLEVVNRLIEAGADVTAEGNAAIIRAAMYGHLEVVNRLIEAGADVTAEGNDVIRRAAWRGHLEVVNRLIEAGADVTTHGNAAILEAAWYGHLEVVETLAKNSNVFAQRIPGFVYDYLANVSSCENLHQIACANISFRDYLREKHSRRYQEVLDFRRNLREQTYTLYKVFPRDLVRMIMFKGYGSSANSCVEQALRIERPSPPESSNQAKRTERASQTPAQDDRRRSRAVDAQDGMASPSPQKRQRNNNESTDGQTQRAFLLTQASRNQRRRARQEGESTALEYLAQRCVIG